MGGPNSVLQFSRMKESSSMNSLRSILFVEDDLKDQELMLAALAEENLAATLVFARNGEEALDYLYHRGKYALRMDENPSVVILDLKMPKIDGLEVLRRIRSDPSLKLLPVVFLTSSREEGDLLQGYGLGANAYVVKPVDFREFANRVKQLGVFWALINEPPPGTLKRS